MSTPSRPGSGFVPVGDMAGRLELPGRRVLIPQPATLEARRHFTSLDQVDQLVGASESDAELGFMGRLLALCTIPRTNPGDRLQYKRVNGPYKLIMIAGGDNKLPYGNLPRPAPGVGLHRSGTNAVPCTHSRRFALGVHAECGCLQHWRGGAWSAPRADAAAYSILMFS